MNRMISHCTISDRVQRGRVLLCGQAVNMRKITLTSQMTTKNQNKETKNSDIDAPNWLDNGFDVEETPTCRLIHNSKIGITLVLERHKTESR